MIISRRCDRPMAISKRLLPCNKRCATCVACIVRDELGTEGHVNLQKGSDPVLRARNMMIRSYYGDLY